MDSELLLRIIEYHLPDYSIISYYQFDPLHF